MLFVLDYLSYDDFHYFLVIFRILSIFQENKVKIGTTECAQCTVSPAKTPRAWREIPCRSTSNTRGVVERELAAVDDDAVEEQEEEEDTEVGEPGGREVGERDAPGYNEEGEEEDEEYD